MNPFDLANEPRQCKANKETDGGKIERRIKKIHVIFPSMLFTLWDRNTTYVSVADPPEKKYNHNIVIYYNSDDRIGVNN